MNQSSYVAASAFPIKLVKSNEAVVNNQIVPVYVQLNPTNRCNGRCPWCSCSEVDRTLEMPADEVFCILEHFTRLGTRAWVITGGGEPTLHPALPEIIYHIHRLGGEIGLTTNGLEWGARQSDELKKLSPMITWARYSLINDRMVSIKTFCENLPATDVGVSMVVAEGVDVDLSVAICRMVDCIPNLTHVRFVQEILSLDEGSMASVESACKGITNKAFFQWRGDYTSGRKQCLISRLKPLIDASGLVYPCCGVQYATEPPSRGMPIEFSMGKWSEFHLAPVFDGSVCVKCYYDSYNVALAQRVEPVQHEKFL